MKLLPVGTRVITTGACHPETKEIDLHTYPAGLVGTILETLEDREGYKTPYVVLYDTYPLDWDLFDPTGNLTYWWELKPAPTFDFLWGLGL